MAISRIVEIFRGQIEIDGVDISKISLKSLRSRITVIPQEPTMFTGTLRFNLDPEDRASDEEILRLLKEAKLDTLLEHPEGINQEISEGGQNLSTGERQLICICRAVLRKSKLVLLDEATSNIDVVTEKKIQSLIEKEFHDSTMLVVAHRLNTIMKSDRVLVLDQGKVAEFDSPKNLMSDSSSQFSKLLQHIEKEE